MREDQYYREIENLIKNNEISERVRKLEENNELVTTYWEIGKLIVEAQGGKKYAKYGNELIKKWSVKLTELYGKGYDILTYLGLGSFIYVFQFLARCANI